ncbi:hypothetical protein EST38_g4358 [Candolleomyces aberdarensis]|uniref:Uncharacterized protein n=1 Tax=Candolleomyces aberdarensis TaxID=2316362 RepID=A0A4Q2DMT9_9AGAR|nr:hypothetical protein EST38_g4358 [Candolleomyces aberdarensis]
MQSGVEFLALKTVRDQWAANVPLQADYANFVTVCQSSGTGKSRMVDELGQYIFTIPFNVRADEGGGAYPLPDEEVRDYLAPTVSYEEAYIQRCQIFFSTLFRAISGFLIRCKGEGSLSALQLAHVWRLFLGENRGTFYSELVERSRQIARTGGDYVGPEAPFAQLQALVSSEQLDPQQSFSNLPVVANLSKDKLHSYISNGKENAENAKKALDTRQIPVNHGLKVVIYFDEAHTLLKASYVEQEDEPTAETTKTVDDDLKPTVGMRKSMYHHILSVLNTLKEYGFFAIFLSTSSRIRILAPPPSQASSARQTDDRAPLAPITEIAFDCHPDLSAGIALNQKLSTCRSIEFMAKFGRVLFWALLEGSYTPAQVLNLAKNKIAGYQYRASDASLRKPEEDGTLACLDLRLSFDYDLRRDPLDGKEERLVENHMRLCYSVPTQCAYLWSGYSSEPLLAEETHAATIRNCKPDVASSSPDPKWPPSFSEALGRGWIRFTHFGKLGDSTCGVSQMGLYAAFVRGMAYIGKPNQGNSDVIIPVCLAKSDDFSPQDMTAIFVQFKARKVKGGHRHDYTAEDLEAFPECDRALPYCTLLMELGIPPKCRSAKTVGSSQELRRKERRENSKPHLRYNIRAFGSTSNIYKPIEREHQDDYHNVFRTMAPLNEHARQNAEHISQILTMKPEWTCDSFNSLHWLKSEVTTVSDDELEEPKVEVGPVTLIGT